MPDIIVMFFILGLTAGLLRSDLEIPKAAYDILSLLLMLTIGLKGGMALHGTFTLSLLYELLIVVAIGALMPLALIPILRTVFKLGLDNSVSIAAHYGSVSAGTFAVVLAYVESRGIPFGPQTTLYLVMLELPAIIVSLLVYRAFTTDQPNSNLKHLWHESLTNSGVILLVGGMVIGALYGPHNGASVTDMLTAGFKAVLAIFLLEMGLTAAETLRKFPKDRWTIALFALGVPPVFAGLGVLTGFAMGLPEGSILILSVMMASASYIAAPAAIKNAVPSADIGLAMLLSLGITFPFNVLIGIPLYHSWIQNF